jgi:hypothetical protein
MNVQQGNIQSLANFLQGKRQCVLVLGAGASLSSGVPGMPEIVRKAVREHGNKEQNAQLKTDPRVLPKELDAFFQMIDRLAEPQLRAILERLFPKGQEPSKGYGDLAKLVVGGCFPVILSTNIDLLLETALSGKGLKLTIDVDIIDCGDISNPNDTSIAELLVRKIQSETPPIKLVKLHGSLVGMGKLKFRPKDIFDLPTNLREAVEKLVNDEKREVVIVGHNMHDADLNRCFHQRGSGIWYVNPEQPEPGSFIHTVLQAREGSCYISDSEGFFDRFFERLSGCMEVEEKEEEIAKIEFVNRRRELDDLKKALSLPGHPPVVAVSGPMGYGKTRLLGQATAELRNEGWKCALLECEKHKEASMDSLVQAVASEFKIEGVTANWNDVGRYLAQQVHKDLEYKTIALVDGIDWLSENMRRRMLTEGLSSLYWFVTNAKGKCRFVVSGRQIEETLDQVAEQIHQKGEQPFGQIGAWYEEKPLSEFSRDVVKELVDRESVHCFEHNVYELLADNLLAITGGHPQAIVDIVMRWKEEGWSFGGCPGGPEFYFTDERKEDLFKTHVSKAVQEIGRKIGEEWLADFRAVCMLREITASVLQCLIERGAIRQFAEGSELLSWLQRRRLVRPKGKGWWGDAIARGVFVAEMKMVLDNRDRHRQLNQWARDSFWDSLGKTLPPLDKIDEAQREHFASVLAPYLVTCGVEFVYHSLEAQYPADRDVLAQTFNEAKKKVVDKLAPLGKEILRQFDEEVARIAPGL